MTINVGRARWCASVTVLPKAGVNDPEGEAILGGLKQLGYADVSRVRAGRIFHVFVESQDESTALTEATRMAEQLLANPVLEQFSVEIEPVQA